MCYLQWNGEVSRTRYQFVCNSVNWVTTKKECVEQLIKNNILCFYLKIVNRLKSVKIYFL